MNDKDSFLLESLQLLAETPVNQGQIYTFWRMNIDKIDASLIQIMSDTTSIMLETHDKEMREFIAAILWRFGDLIQTFPLGNRGINLELAITAYQVCASVFTREEYPSVWAALQNKLGNVSRQRIEDKIEFLHESLYLSGRSQGNPERVYTFWRMNIDKIDASLIRLMPELASLILEKKSTEAQEIIAVTFVEFGNLIQKFPLGNRGINLELAITAYQVCASVFTRKEYPSMWAALQNYLGNAYRERIEGERKENIELAIQAYRASLEVTTRQKFPVEWAALQMFLGNAYQDRTEGERKENIELAIQAYRASLEVYTRQNFPIMWARVQYNLGVAYYDRVEGECKANLELAIQAFRTSLEVRTRQDFPIQWADIQNNLGSAYRVRIEGERKENLELAIQAFQAALEVYTRHKSPVKWAMTQNNLGNAYCDRIEGKHRENRENLEQAIQAFQAALEVYTRQDFPVDWADTQNSLGFVYANRVEGKHKENLEQAIGAFQAALEVYTRQDFPVKWALTQNSLGVAYRVRIEGERRENFEQAIGAFRAAQEVYTRQNFPVEWALTQNNLGSAYIKRIKGERRENLEQAIGAFQAALEVYTRQNFPVKWASTQNNLSNAYQQRIEGERRENLELSIQACQVLLEIYTLQDFPGEWAMTQFTLGNAYYSRIEGAPKENLELAIGAFQAALEVYTRQDFPLEWASTQNSLGIAYRSRIEGNRKANFELAIGAFQAALEVYTRQDFPVDWAGIQNNLGNAYWQRIEGEHKENLELAIGAFQAALEVYTRQDFPVDWAGTQNSLGVAYNTRIKGERRENFEQAIGAFRAAQEVYTRQNFPVEWALTQNNLGSAYIKRIKGERRENLEQAIGAFQAALEVYTRQNFPVKWASTQNNLSNAYQQRIEGERRENLELSIQACQVLLEIYTLQDFPDEWAMTQFTLGNAYYSRIEGERKENLELAIQAYRAAQKVFTQQDFPIEWASTQNNLSNAYQERIEGDRKGNLELAIQAYRAALEVCQPELIPHDCLRIGGRLGKLAFKEGNWHIAIEGFEKAIAAVEKSRSWATNETSRQEIQAGAVSEYAAMVQACINAGKLDLALETLERSRSKRLVELMSINDFYQDGNTPDQIQSYLRQYEALQRQIDELRLDLRMTSESTLVDAESSRRSRAALGAVDQDIQELEQQKQMVRQQISRLDPVSAGLLEVRALNLTEIQQLLDQPNTALLSFCITTNRTHIFVVRQNQLTYHPCAEQENTLSGWLYDQWLWAYLGIRRANDGTQRLPHSSWKSNLPSVLAEISQRLQIEDLIQNHLQAIDELILIPHFGLHQIPFTALPTSQGPLGDRFTLRVVPSCQVLQFCHQRPPLTPELLGLIEDASGDLPCSSFEAESVATLYNVSPGLRLRGLREATVANCKRLLQEQEIQMLLSCHHAQSRLDNPLESKLELADGAITLGELLSPAWRLPQLADVFLSCCETGLGRSLDETDDVLTLATGFLCAGARSVISTLWSVDDLATAIFSILYHQNRHEAHGNMNRPQALQRTQQILREMTGSTLNQVYRPKLEAMLNLKYDEADNNRRQATTEQERNYWAGVAIRVGDTLDRLEYLCEQPYPFEHPIYWAGFVCYGLR